MIDKIKENIDAQWEVENTMIYITGDTHASYERFGRKTFAL